MTKCIGHGTIEFSSSPSIIGFAAVGGKKEGDGPLGSHFDIICNDTKFGKDTWEQAESEMQHRAVVKAIEKSGLEKKDIDIILAGDLLNQCIGSSFDIRSLGIPFLGLYGACSTMAETLLIGSMFVDGGGAGHCICATSSHFASAERQYRFPLNYGGQRTPTAQWTATASGAVVLGKHCGKSPNITRVKVGKICDLGICDANNMGAAMAPAAADTLSGFLSDTGAVPEDYDVIMTGDLGSVGSKLFAELLEKDGISLSDRHADGGLMLYTRSKQDTHCGGSGCGCSASVLCSVMLPALVRGDIKKMLFIATGALLSPTATQQGESIPGIAHLIEINTQ